MEPIKAKPIPCSNHNHNSTQSKSKFAKTFKKVISLRTATKIASNNGIGICVLAPHSKFPQKDSDPDHRNGADGKARQRAVLEALAAKLFASVTAIKAAYAELQMAQNPYNGGAIQAADQAVVEELRTLSELKRKFLKKELDLSPQITLMLAEIQEQQSLMRTFEIMIKKMESEAEFKDSEITALKKRLEGGISSNRLLEKKLNESGPLSMFDNLQFSSFNSTHFVQFLYCAVRSVRSFVKLMIREMEVAHWDLDAAAGAIESGAGLAKPSDRWFVFEAFVCRTMLEGFESPDFALKKDSPTTSLTRELFFARFKALNSASSIRFLTQNPKSSFAKFTRAKYLNLVHAKMECSFFGNLNQRKMMNSGEFPDSAFFRAFAEMAKRVWLLHCLAFSLTDQVSIFQVGKSSRFSEVYMENVGDEDSLFSGDIGDGNLDIRVGFTVVPGFKIGKDVIQSQVYLSPVVTPPVSR